MTKRTAKPGGTQGANGAGGALAEVLAPLVAGMTATRASLLAWVHAQGVVALREVFAAEAAAFSLMPPEAACGSQRRRAAQKSRVSLLPDAI